MPFHAPLPWQTQQWENLLKRHRRQQLPHALLFSGMPGLGKSLFAVELSKTLLCRHAQKTNSACGECQSCQLMTAGTYPEYYFLQPENESKIIRVDQIRSLVEKLTQTPIHGQYKIAIIEPAEAMAPAAANALLKTLEEPNGNAILILISSQAPLLPATIRSRCQTILFQPPSKQDAIIWLKQEDDSQADYSLTLQLAEGAPLQAISLLKSLGNRKKLVMELKNIYEEKTCPVQLSALLQKEFSMEMINCLISVTMDLARLKMGLTFEHVTNKDMNDFFEKSISAIMISRVFLFLDKLYSLKQSLNKNNNLNQQLVLENLFCIWHSLFNK
jgi:DNA polymerase-3 subunit delta'